MTSTLLKWNTRIYIVGSSCNAEWATPLQVTKDEVKSMAYLQRLDAFSNDWENYDMVGFINPECCTPANIDIIGTIIKSDDALKSGFHQFAFSGETKPYTQPLLQLIDKICKDLNFHKTNRPYSPWICSVSKMHRFLSWFKEKVQPAMISQIPDMIKQSDYHKKGAKDIDLTKTLIAWKLFGGFFDQDPDDVKMMDQFSVSQDSTISLVENTEYDRVVSTKKAKYSEILSVMGLMDQEMKLLKIAESELAEVKRRYDAVTAGTISATAERNLIKSNMEKYSADLVTVREEINGYKQEISVVKDEYLQKMALKGTMQSDLLSVKEQLQKDISAIKITERALIDTVAQSDNMQRKYLEEEAKLNALIKSRDTHKQTVEDIQLKIAACKEDVVAQTALIAEFSAEYKTVFASKKELTAEFLVVKESGVKERAQLKQIEQNIADTNKQLEKDKKAYQEANNTLQARTKMLENGQQSVIDIRSKTDSVTENISKLNIVLDDNKVKFNELKKEYDQTVVSKNEINGQIATIKDLLVKEKRQIKLTEQSILDENKQLEKNKIINKDLDAVLQGKNKELQYSAASIEEKNLRIITIADEIAKCDASLAETQSRLTVATAAMVESDSKLKDAVAVLKAEEDLMTKKSDELKSIEARYAEIMSASVNMHSRNNELSDEIMKQNAIIENITFKIKSNEETIIQQRSQLHELGIKNNAVASSKEDLHRQVGEAQELLNKTTTENTKIAENIVEIKLAKEDLLKKQRQISANLDILTNIFAKNSQIFDDIKRKTEAITEEIGKQNIIINKAREGCSISTIELENVSTSRVAQANKLSELNLQIKKEVENIKSIEKEIALAISSKSATEKQSRDMQNELDVLTKLRDKNNLLIAATNMKNETLTNDISEQAETITATNALLAKSTTELDKSKLELDQIASARIKVNNQITEIKTQIIQESETLKSNERLLADITKKYNAEKKNAAAVIASLTSSTKALEDEIKQITINKKIIAEKQADIHLNIRDGDDIRETLKNIREEHTRVLAAKGTLSNHLAEAKKLIGDDSGKLKQLEQSIPELTKEHEKIAKKNRELTSTFNDLSKLLEKDKGLNNDLIAQIILKNDERAKISGLVNDNKKQYTEIAAEKVEFDNKLAELREQTRKELERIKSTERETIDVTKQRDNILSKYKEVLSSNKEAVAALEKSNATVENARAQRQTLNKDIARNQALYDDAKSGMIEIKAEYEQLVFSRNELNTKLSETKSLLAKESANVKNAELMMTECNKLIEQEKQKYKDLTTEHERKLLYIHDQKKHSEEMHDKSAILEAEIIKYNKMVAADMARFNDLKLEYEKVLSEKTKLQEEIAPHIAAIDADKLINNTIRLELSEITSTLQLEKDKTFELTNTIDTTNLEITKYKQLTENLRDSIAAANVAITLSNEEYNDVNKEYKRIIITKSEFADRLSAVKALLYQEEAQVISIKEIIDENNANIQKEEAINKQLQQSLRDAKYNLHISLVKKKENEDKIATIVESIDDIEIELKETTIKLEDQQHKLASLNDTKQRIKTKFEENNKMIMTLNIENKTLQSIKECAQVVNKPQNNNIKIYILCHTTARFNEAKNIYKAYAWAIPIVMKYQDITFENAFWKQLYEIREEWFDCTMVGTMSFKVSKKLNLSIVDGIINNPGKWSNGYYHFMDKEIAVSNKTHPNLVTILSDVCKTLDLEMPTENCCNYWMCSAEKMIQFLVWYEEAARDVVLAHPLSITNAKYIGALTQEELLKLGKYPYYTHAPFVFERLFKSFFKTLE